MTAFVVRSGILVGEFCILGELHPVRSITTDNGSEFRGFKEIERLLDTKVYFANPHHAWERGTNENTNGLVRQYLPKGTCLADLTQEQCDAIAAKLNHRLRKGHGYLFPHEVYYLLATLNAACNLYTV